MSTIGENNKRIAKNTLFLYFRMLFLMLVSLYTSRIILNALGVEDYGIYNVVGGVVAMFSMFSASLTSAISRFIAYELGCGNKDRLIKVFSSAVTIQIIISIIVIILAETVGLWFLNAKMQIPENRLYAANWVYQFSLLTFVVNLISVPYNALIVAHERMSAFAYISVAEAIGKLLVSFCILINPIDRLIFYSLMLMLIAVSIRILYGWYCKRHFEESAFRFIKDVQLLKQMFSFGGWNFIGSTAGILRDHGANVIINLFCGPAVNAARAIAIQVNTAINSFVQNFMIALNPQIIKSYAQGDLGYMMKLTCQGARFSFYLLLILSFPVIVNTSYILHLWLKILPEHTVLFVQLILVLAMHECLAVPLVTVILATGKVRNYQIMAGGLNMMNLPVGYVLLKLGYPAESVVVVAIIFSFIVQIVRLYMLHKVIRFNVLDFLNKVYLNITMVLLAACILPVVMYMFFEENPVNDILSIVLCFLFALCSVWGIGCSKEEKEFVLGKLQLAIKKKLWKK